MYSAEAFQRLNNCVSNYQRVLLTNRCNRSKQRAHTNLGRGSPSIKLWVWPYHYSGGNGYTSTAVRVGNDVTETDAQKCDSNEPHGIKEIRVLLVVKPGVTQEKTGWNIREHSSDARPNNHTFYY